MKVLDRILAIAMNPVREAISSYEYPSAFNNRHCTSLRLR